MDFIFQRNVNFLHYAVRTCAFFVFVSVSVLSLPVYRAKLPDQHQEQQHHTTITTANSARRGGTASNSYDRNNNMKISNNVETGGASPSWIDMTMSMKLCFEIMAPSMEIGLHPPEVVMRMCANRIPPSLLCSKSISAAENRSSSSSSSSSFSSSAVGDDQFKTSGATMLISPSDKPYVQSVLRHFSSIVVFHDAAFVLYHDVREYLVKRAVVADPAGNDDGHTDFLPQNNKKMKKKAVGKTIDEDTNKDKAKALILKEQSYLFWIVHYPEALALAFIKRRRGHLVRIIEATNWLRLLPSLMFVSPQARVTFVSFYALALVTNGQHPCKLSDFSIIFHVCAVVAIVEWVSAILENMIWSDPLASSSSSSLSLSSSSAAAAVGLNNAAADASSELAENDDKEEEDENRDGSAVAAMQQKKTKKDTSMSWMYAVVPVLAVLIPTFKSAWSYAVSWWRAFVLAASSPLCWSQPYFIKSSHNRRLWKREATRFVFALVSPPLIACVVISVLVTLAFLIVE